VHRPYAPTAPYRGSFARRWPLPAAIAATVPPAHRDELDAYDDSILEVDALAGTFLRKLERLGVAQETFVVLLSDHGDAFGEHGVTGHGFNGHQAALHIPFVLRGPGVPAGLRVETPVSIVDVAPTMLDLLGLPPLDGAQGRTLRAAIDGKPLATVPLYFSWIGTETRGVRVGDLKVMARGDRYAVHSLSDDPGEVRPLAWERGKPLLDLLVAHEQDSARQRAALDRRDAEAEGIRISPDTARDLRALGYVE
jgi:choline-sulfatase